MPRRNGISHLTQPPPRPRPSASQTTKATHRQGRARQGRIARGTSAGSPMENRAENLRRELTQTGSRPPPTPPVAGPSGRGGGCLSNGGTDEAPPRADPARRTPNGDFMGGERRTSNRRAGGQGTSNGKSHGIAPPTGARHTPQGRTPNRRPPATRGGERVVAARGRDGTSRHTTAKEDDQPPHNPPRNQELSRHHSTPRTP